VSRVAGLIPAAGRSSRMGRPKPLLDYRGRTFLDRIVGELRAAAISPVAVVVAGGDEQLSTEVRRLNAVLVVNPRPELGMLSSVVVGLDVIEREHPDALLLWPVDCPAVGRATVRRLVETWQSTGAPVVIPVREGRRGHPVLFSAAVFADLREAPSDIGPRAVVRRHAHDLVEVAVTDGAITDDIDTPEDLDRLR